MPLLERYPNNAAIDAQLRKHGIDPSRIGSLPTIDPNRIAPEQWEQFENDSWAFGVIGRHKVMQYDFGAPKAISPAVANATSHPVTRTLTGEEEIGTETTFHISATVEAGFFDVVKVSVTSGFSQTWTQKKKFTDSLQVIIPPGHMMWLEATPVMRILDGDFVYYLSLTGVPLTAGRFSGTVTAPGVEGSLRDVIVAREVPMPAQMLEKLRAAAEATSRPKNPPVRRHNDGTITLPGFVAAAMLGDSAKSEDVTDQVRPA
ncbi:hypothetical protein [Streptomyces sp. x-19]|uniref:hypothetical protein n=1 Tax=Streptomyces sp. x-19 TaxID=2789280 RepID=UPI003980C9CC